MKRLLLPAIAVGLFCFQSCSEIGPTINGLNGEEVAKGDIDTAYTADIEAPQTKKVLVEEFTGVSCPPCPNAARLLKSLNEQVNGNLVIIAYHIFNYPQANPVEKDGEKLSKYDFRTEDATEVGSSIFGGISALPQAGFDRTPVNGGIGITSGAWSATAENRVKETVPVNIHLTTTYDEATSSGTVLVKLAYTETVTVKENITLAIVEDSIVDAQKDGLQILKEYTHKHVLRDIITPVIGTPVPPKVEPKEAGKVYETSFSFAIKEDWHVEHCHIVAFVNRDDASDRSIVQAAETKIIN